MKPKLRYFEPVPAMVAAGFAAFVAWVANHLTHVNFWAVFALTILVMFVIGFAAEASDDYCKHSSPPQKPEPPKEHPPAVIDANHPENPPQQ